MTQETPASTIDLQKMGNPSCDKNAQEEALRVMGYGTDGQPLSNGQKADLREIQRQFPQLLARDANGALLRNEHGNVMWSPAIDIAHIGKVEVKSKDGKTTQEKPCIERAGANGKFDKVEFEAMMIALAQVHVETKRPLKDIKVEEVAERLPQILKIITGDITPVCGKDPGFKL